MDQNASAALITSIVAVVLGGLGLAGGIIGYVQGSAALRRASVTRQRASTAEEAALQARDKAEAAARAVEQALEQLREERVRPAAPPAAVQRAQEVRAPTTGSTPVVSNARHSSRTGPVPVVAPAQTPEDAVDAPERAAASTDGRVAAGDQEAPPMDWAEALRTGSVPLPSRSRGTYAAPKKRPRRPGEGPVRFEIEAVGRQRFEAVNVGGTPAEDAVIEGVGEDRNLVRPVKVSPSTVPAGEALVFSVLRVEGRRVTVRVRWRAGGEVASDELPLP